MRSQGINGLLITELRTLSFLTQGSSNSFQTPISCLYWVLDQLPPKIKKPILFYPALSLHCRRKFHLTFSTQGAANNSGAFGVGGEKNYG